MCTRPRQAYIRTRTHRQIHRGKRISDASGILNEIHSSLLQLPSKLFPSHEEKSRCWFLASLCMSFLLLLPFSNQKKGKEGNKNTFTWLRYTKNGISIMHKYHLYNFSFITTSSSDEVYQNLLTETCARCQKNQNR